MAIRVEAIVAIPPYPEQENPSPILVKKDAAQIIQEKLERLIQSIQAPFVRISASEPITLFDIDSQEYGSIPGDEDDHPGFSVPRKELQEAGIEVMSRYGFDPDVSSLGSETNLSNRTIRERREYPSQTIKGLTFVRWYTHTADSKEPISVWWQAEDTAPAFKRRNKD